MGTLQNGKNWLRKRVRELLYRCLLKRLSGPFAKLEGNAWRAKLPKEFEQTKSGDRPPLLLFENRRYLGPEEDQTNHVEVVGRGWYRQPADHIVFSTSDNSDPNVNGREYSFSTSAWLNARQSGSPVNLQALSNDQKRIESDVNYAMDGYRYLEVAKSVGFESLHGKRVLELGPGINMGHAALLTCAGADVTTVDPFPTSWQSAYHQKFYSQLRDELQQDSSLDTKPLDQLLAADRFSTEVIDSIHAPVEGMQIENESIDCVFSLAVGEHFYDPRQAFEQLYRVTKPGGFGFHWIDFRDHRNFDRPLEYLLMSHEEFQIEFGLHRGEIGTQLRLNEYLEIVRNAGFEIVSQEITQRISESYLQEFLPRLRACERSPYKNYPEEDLRDLCVFVCLKRA